MKNAQQPKPPESVTVDIPSALGQALADKAPVIRVTGTLARELVRTPSKVGAAAAVAAAASSPIIAAAAIATRVGRRIIGITPDVLEELRKELREDYEEASRETVEEASIKVLTIVYRRREPPG